MKPLLIFLLLAVCSFWIDLKPIRLEDFRTEEINVTVRGAVKEQGEISLPLYASIQDALEKTGVSDQADLSGINPQQILRDHDVLTVPFLPDNTAAPKVLLNSADAAALATLPGIGPSTADRIIQYRRDNGLFQSTEDLMNVSGIGPAKFARIKDLIGL